MKVDIVDLNKFIKVNDIQEVTNPIPFDSGRYPTDDGVLSYKIFGISGSYDRKTIFGYIDLKKHFLHPLMYKLLTRMDQKLTRVINGTGYFVINDNGELIEDNMNGETGISWLYKNFDKLYYSRNSSIKRGRKIDLLENMTKDEIFCNKWLVIPAHLRDVNINNIKHGKLSKDELNDKYNKLIGLCQSSSSEFDFMGMITEFNIQKCLVDIYDYLTGYLAGKKGLIHANLLGKTVDYSTRSVISAGRVKSDLPVNQTIKFSYTGIPLSHLCNLFFPFFQYEIKSWAEETFMTVKELKDTKGRSWRLLDPMGEFTPDKITKMLSLYIKSPEHRLDRIYIDAECQETGVKGKIPLLVYKESLKRDFTILDLIFIVAHKVCKDKHVYVTRYPVENFMSIFPSRIKIVTTYETMPLEIDNKYFEEYPVVAKDEEHPNIGAMPNYVDTVIPHNSVLESLGADFDGDTVSIRSVYTQEANIECEKIINSLKYILDLNGKSTRVIRNEGIQTLYTLTRDWN